MAPPGPPRAEWSGTERNGAEYRGAEAKRRSSPFLSPSRSAYRQALRQAKRSLHYFSPSLPPSRSLSTVSLTTITQTTITQTTTHKLQFTYHNFRSARLSLLAGTSQTLNVNTASPNDSSHLDDSPSGRSPRTLSRTIVFSRQVNLGSSSDSSGSDSDDSDNEEDEEEKNRELPVITRQARRPSERTSAKRARQFEHP